MRATQNAVTDNEYRNLPVTCLVESANNPRRRFDEKSLEELADVQLILPEIDLSLTPHLLPQVSPVAERWSRCLQRIPSDKGAFHDRCKKTDSK
jgi:hypothetical protein